VFLATIYITLKPTVNDPQGLTVKGGLHSLGFESVESVRVGKYLEIRVAETDKGRAEAKVHDMCRELLANPIIENYRFELEEISG
jgi:phosphoribosylformylglycinamidine synthase PurS subunit